MEPNWLLAVFVFVIGISALLGFFCTKEKGFGPFNTSALLLLLVVIFAALLFVYGKLEQHPLVNVLFAVIGFAGGLFTSGGLKDCKPPKEDKPQKPTPLGIKDV